MATAVAYYLSSGKLLIPSVIHGAYDATGFIGVTMSHESGVLLRGSMILFGVIVGIAIFGQICLGKECRVRRACEKLRGLKRILE